MAITDEATESPENKKTEIHMLPPKRGQIKVKIFSKLANMVAKAGKALNKKKIKEDQPQQPNGSTSMHK
ncbi:hypothetical protein JCGZ_16450 [Jatropha curcas]|uniref:Uncharacterized protein n=1 Tax=Jatropha curcas TaxID=180498 RepID=A0A067JYL6_JATCU|nr:hypothetical protein JCGZ_16450 [Jatropha curcas]